MPKPISLGKHELAEIAEMRETLGMKPLDCGETPCHRCGKTFWSWSRKKNRHCYVCKTILEQDDAGCMGVGEGDSRRVTTKNKT